MARYINTIKLLFLTISGVIIVILVSASFFAQKFTASPEIVLPLGVKDHSIEPQSYEQKFQEIEKHKQEFQKYYFENTISLPENIKYSQAKAQGIPVLLYHGIDEQSNTSDHISITQFLGHMIGLKRAGYQTITLQDYLAFSRGEKKLPDKSFLLTFDDGRKDSFYNADPILEKLGFNAVMFVITKFVEQEDNDHYLSNSELLYMAQSGRWEIQPHGHNAHENINIAEDKQGHYLTHKEYFINKNRIESDYEYRTRIEQDLVKTGNIIRDKFGQELIAFAFPFGDYGQNENDFYNAQNTIIKIIANIYPISFYQTYSDKGQNFNTPNQGLLQKRISIQGDWSTMYLMDLLERENQKQLPYEEKFLINNNWNTPWGRLDIVYNKIVLSSGEDTNGGAIVLGGSSLWKNYQVRAEIDLEKGESFTLLTRYQDEENYISCVYSTTGVRLEERYEGTDRVLKKWDNLFHPLEFNNIQVGMRVYENEYSCLMNNNEILINKDNISRNNRGGIGFKTWDREKNNSEINIKELMVVSVII